MKEQVEPRGFERQVPVAARSERNQTNPITTAARTSA
jgi:hypothetical protein